LGLIGVRYDGKLPDVYWKNRILLTEIGEEKAQEFVDMAGRGAACYYERKTGDRRYSRFPFLMYAQNLRVEHLLEVRSIIGYGEWRAEFGDAGREGLADDESAPCYLHGRVRRDDGGWEELWRDGDLRLVRADAPIGKVETDGAFSLGQELGGYTRGDTPADYRSVSRRLDWNYTRYRVTDAEDWPVHGREYDKETKTTMRFVAGLLDGDARTRGGEPLVKPAYAEPGHEEYWRNGFLHRDGGRPAVVAENDGVKEWWVSGVLVRAETDI
jgi:hypothetical protein